MMVEQSQPRFAAEKRQSTVLPKSQVRHWRSSSSFRSSEIRRPNTSLFPGRTASAEPVLRGEGGQILADTQRLVVQSFKNDSVQRLSSSPNWKGTSDLSMPRPLRSQSAELNVDTPDRDPEVSRRKRAVLSDRLKEKHGSSSVRFGAENETADFLPRRRYSAGDGEPPEHYHKKFEVPSGWANDQTAASRPAGKHRSEAGTMRDHTAGFSLERKSSSGSSGGKLHSIRPDCVPPLLDVSYISDDLKQLESPPLLHRTKSGEVESQMELQSNYSSSFSAINSPITSPGRSPTSFSGRMSLQPLDTLEPEGKRKLPGIRSQEKVKRRCAMLKKIVSEDKAKKYPSQLYQVVRKKFTEMEDCTSMTKKIEERAELKAVGTAILEDDHQELLRQLFIGYDVESVREQNANAVADMLDDSERPPLSTRPLVVGFIIQACTAVGLDLNIDEGDTDAGFFELSGEIAMCKQATQAEEENMFYPMSMPGSPIRGSRHSSSFQVRRTQSFEAEPQQPERFTRKLSSPISQPRNFTMSLNSFPQQDMPTL